MVTMMQALLRKGLAGLGLELSESQMNTLAAFARLLEKWNKTYNLTAVRDTQGIVALHLLDSLAVAPYLPKGATRMLDVGSGGGLPGIPLAIACPALDVTLLDSNSKKSAFQRQAIIELGLSNVQAVTSRVEQFQPGRRFDRIISRAYSDVAEFVGQTLPLLAEDGVWLAMKGVPPLDELARLPESVVAHESIPLDVPGVDGERCLIVLKRAGGHHTGVQ